MTDIQTESVVNTATDVSTEASTAPAPTEKRARPARPNVLPVLEKLATLYPHLFGATFRPLKRGIFQDLLEAQPGSFEKESLKDALSTHTRSTRYLASVSSGMPRTDLQGQPVEAMAPEHVHHALLEVFRRRQGRAAEDLTPQLQARIVQAIDASGLSPEAYAELVRARNEAANTLLDQALSDIAQRTAKDEALLRAFEASGQTVEAFAEMYGMKLAVVAAALKRARTPLATSVGPEA
jgi:ProP effector